VKSITHFVLYNNSMCSGAADHCIVSCVPSVASRVHFLIQVEFYGALRECFPLCYEYHTLFVIHTCALVHEALGHELIFVLGRELEDTAQHANQCLEFLRLDLVSVQNRRADPLLSSNMCMLYRTSYICTLLSVECERGINFEDKLYFSLRAPKLILPSHITSYHSQPGNPSLKT
jgi:hypothetical protein